MNIRNHLLAASALALSLAACGEDTNEPTTDQTDTGTDGGGDATLDPAPYHGVYRVTNLDILEPGGLGDLLEGLINTDIEAGNVHILVSLREATLSEDGFNTEITGNAGTYADGTSVDSETPVYEWFIGDDGEQVVPSYVRSLIFEAADGSAAIENSQPLALVFPALNNTEPPSTIDIPAKEIDLVGSFPTEGTMTALLDGAILLSDAQEINFQLAPGTDPINLADVLNVANLNFPADAGEGNYTGWAIQAVIQSEMVDTAAGTIDAGELEAL